MGLCFFWKERIANWWRNSNVVCWKPRKNYVSRRLPAGATDLHRSTASNPVEPSPSVTDESGDVVGSLILFLKDGLLSSLEIASWFDPLPLPRFDQVVWDAST